MKIRIYLWEEHNTFNAIYRLTHPDNPGYEHKSGVTKIEYEADNGQVHSFRPMVDTEKYAMASSVDTVIFKCKNCQTLHVMLREDNVPMKVHFTNPCQCGNINTDSYKASGCLVCQRPLPVFERITDYRRNFKHETIVARVMDEDLYNSITKDILKDITG